ncbi:hypothetical protein Tco_1021031 [Tanacetum coccineum]
MSLEHLIKCIIQTCSKIAERVSESKAFMVKVVAFVVIGVGIGVDCYGRGMNGGIGGGMVIAGAIEVLGITVTGTVRSGVV